MKKKNLFIAGILAFALIFTLGFTGCGDPAGGDEGGEQNEDPYVFPEEATTYLGSWRDDEIETSSSFVQILDDGSFQFKYSNKGTTQSPGQGIIDYTVENAEWVKLTDLGTTPEEYTIGYKITGSLKEITWEQGVAYTGETYTWFRNVVFAPVVETGDALYHNDNDAANVNKSLDPYTLKEEGDEVTIYVFFKADGTSMILGTSAGGQDRIKFNYKDELDTE